MKVRVKVEAGRHERINCPIGVSVPHCPQRPALVQVGSGMVLPAQSQQAQEGVIVHAILPYMAAGTTTEFDLIDAGDGAPRTAPPLVAPQNVGGECDGDDRLDVTIGGRYFTTYHYGPGNAKPFVGPVFGQWGDSITRLEYDTKEHVHQKSVWYSHGDVNGIDTWSEEPGHGFQRHDRFLTLSEGDVFGLAVSANTWTDNAGNPLMCDVRELRFFNTPEDLRIVDLSVKMTASHGRVVLGQTKEGTMGIRVANSIRVDAGGAMVSAFGAVGEEECWGRQAPWCDYHGDINGHHAGVAAFDHPSNLGYPTHWHIRDYGLMAMNNAPWDGAVAIEPNESLEYKFRFVFHSGDTAAARVSEHFHAYANPPAVTSCEI